MTIKQVILYISAAMLIIPAIILIILAWLESAALGAVITMVIGFMGLIAAI